MASQGSLVSHPTGGEPPPQTDDANQQRIHSPTTSHETDPVFLSPNSRSPSTSGDSDMRRNSQRSLAGQTQAASNSHSPAADAYDSIISPEVAGSLGVASDRNRGSGAASNTLRLINRILTTSFTAAHSLTTYAMSPKHQARVAEMTPGALNDLLDEIDIPLPGLQANDHSVPGAANEWYSSFQMNMESNRDAMVVESLRDQDIEISSQDDGYPGPEGNLQRDEEGRAQDVQMGEEGQVQDGQRGGETQGGQRDDERAADGQRGHGEGRAQNEQRVGEERAQDGHRDNERGAHDDQRGDEGQDGQRGGEGRAQGGQMDGEELPQDRWRDEEDRDRPRGGPPQQDQGADPHAELYGLIQGLVDEMRADRQILVQQIGIGFERTADLIQQVLGRRVAEETPTPPAAGRSKRSQPKITGNAKRRSPDVTLLASQVRKFFTLLVGEDNLLQPSVGAEEAQNYANMWNARKGINVPPCCDEDNFRYDLLGTPRSPWNQSAARVFAVAFRRWAQADLDHTATTDAFFTWIKSLKQNYKKSQLNAAEQGRAQSLARRKTRKRALFHLRLEAAQQHPLLQRHVDIMQRLGPDGMSSDESDVEDGRGGEDPANPTRPIFRVVAPGWRAREVGEWLEPFDSIHLFSRRNSDDLRGQYPRLRLRTSRTRTVDRTARAVKDLPVNAYDPAWLEQQTQADFTVRATNQRYEFQHDNRLFR
ncbi:hypothetical protein PC9H_002871 [Pleurotus ostreatus]|uniref:Uncharacterized protein n=1 Tax=Pleurotus ostreatus TaxID=5322 RepID=A0A8H6ZXA1_PLEOS|nr:uncharacterized protein PC9H_002871 [Pleurotus ostreatus]KAF7436045.1 hypothetical protein PC9H_002871 [Pleurotus ostreatus]